MLKITYIFGGSKNNSKYLTKVSIFSAQQKFFFILEEVIYFDKSLGITQGDFGNSFLQNIQLSAILKLKLALAIVKNLYKGGLYSVESSTDDLIAVIYQILS